MKRLLLTLSLCMTSAFAEERQTLVLDRPNDTLAAVTLTLPAEATLEECGGFDIMAYVCLRVASEHEEAVLSQLSAGVLAQGWSEVGDGHRDARPYTNIFRAPAGADACPPLIMIASGDHTENAAEPLPAGVLEVKITQTVDVMCLFDGLDGQQQ
jgi:hypothetical protein